MQDDRLAFFYRHFLCPHISSTIKDIGIRVPPCIGLMAIQHLVLNVMSNGTGTGTFFIYMINYNTVSNEAMLGFNGTSVHETDIRSFNSNALRVYNPVTSVRHRKTSTTSEIRQKICDNLLDTYPEIHRVKIIDTGKNFSVRI